MTGRVEDILEVPSKDAAVCVWNDEAGQGVQEGRSQEMWLERDPDESQTESYNGSDS